jgi:hypothetical protein
MAVKAWGGSVIAWAYSKKRCAMAIPLMMTPLARQAVRAMQAAQQPLRTVSNQLGPDLANFAVENADMFFDEVINMALEFNDSETGQSLWCRLPGSHLPCPVLRSKPPAPYYPVFSVPAPPATIRLMG